MSGTESHHELMEGAEPPPPGVKAAAIVRWLIIGFVTLVALGSVLSWAGAFRLLGRHAGPGGAATQAESKTYQCPMHPSIVSDRPGECPICGMTLVKIEENAGGAMTGGTSQVAGLANVTLPDERVQRMGVRLSVVEKRVLSEPVRTVARVTADESKLVRVQTRFSGWVERLLASQTGQKVAKGEVLVEIYSRELYTAQQEYLNALRWSGTDSSNRGLAEQARQRLELLGIAPEEIAAIRAAGAPIRALPIRAPRSGYVVAKNVVEGTFVDPGTELFEIADLSRVWAWGDVYERDLQRVSAGEKAVLTVAALPNRSFRGSVTFLQPTLDPRTRTLAARVELDNPGLALRPGMFGEVVIETPTTAGLVIPREAVVDNGDTQYVFVQTTSGSFQPRRIKAAPAPDNQVAVLEGLREGERVVTSGNFLLDSESRLRSAAHSAAQGASKGRTDIPIDEKKYPEKYEKWLECERAHKGMGSMVQDCQNSIPQPWK